MGSRAEKKRARRSVAQEEEEDEKPDRLSDLPDAIIHQILSFLDLKYAIQTCVLSKRWKYLWVSLPDLRFDDRGFTSTKFKKFMGKVLSTRADRTICKFELHSLFNLPRYLMKRIFNYLVSHNVQHLHLNIHFLLDDSRTSCVPLGLFLSCNTLESLKLWCFELADLSESFNFGFTMLTSMDLCNCKFCFKSGSADPFASCPNLKNLRLRGVCFSFSQVLKISGIQLLNLDIENVYASSGKVEIFAPKLTSIYLGGPVVIDFSTIDLPSLCYADIWLRTNNEIWGHGTLYGLDLINLFRGLYNAEVVKLSGMTIKYLNRCCRLKGQQPAPFKRLKSLKVKCDGIPLAMPDYVKKYLLGDNPYEETMCMEGNPYGKTTYAEFRKVQV